MRFTLMLGAPVRMRDGDFGTLNRIIVNNGVANQFTVDPGGLFSGPDRVVPISDVAEATEDGVTLDASESAWKSYNAFHVEQFMIDNAASAPDLSPVAPRLPTTDEIWDVPTAEGPTEARTVALGSVALSHKTRVGDLGRLAGMVISTGIPEQLLVEGGAAVPFEQVGVLDEEHIVLGKVAGRLDGAIALDGNEQASTRLDGATPPGSVGQERRHDP